MNMQNKNINKFNEHGYFIAKNLLITETSKLINKIDNYISKLAIANDVEIKSIEINKKIKESYKRDVPGFNFKLGNKLYDALNRHILIREYLNNKKIISIVTKIFKCKKSDILLDHIQFFLHLKKDKKNLLGWHQDSGYFKKNSTQNSLTVWIPLQNCNPDDGSLWIKPGSHLEGLQNHKKNKYKNSKSQKITKNGKVYINKVSNKNDFQLKFKTGDVLFADYNLIHRSGLIKSNKVRITCIGRYIDTSKKFLL